MDHPRRGDRRRDHIGGTARRAPLRRQGLSPDRGSRRRGYGAVVSDFMNKAKDALGDLKNNPLLDKAEDIAEDKAAGGRHGRVDRRQGRRRHRPDPGDQGLISDDEIPEPGRGHGFLLLPPGRGCAGGRDLCRLLAGGPWDPTLFAGSLGTASEFSNANRFFGGVRCQSLDYTPAVDRWADGEDPMSAEVPMQASYEDKPGVPDRIFVDLDDAAFARQVHSWTRLMAEHTVAAPSVLHLHHLTPMHEAIRVLWPEVPVITHLHGTELKMLAAVRDGRIPDQPGRFSRTWVARMRRWAGESDRLVVISPQNRQLAIDLLDVDPARVTLIANGVDTETFSPRVRTTAHRLTQWKRWLVDDPRGWCPGGAEGSVSYEADDLVAFTDEAGQAVPVVVFAGRFLRFKRVQLSDRGPSLDAVDHGPPIRARDRWWLPRRVGGRASIRHRPPRRRRGRVLHRLA